jgi:hypothetical protein
LSGGIGCVPRKYSIPPKTIRTTLDAESYALDVLCGRKPDNVHPRKICADAWFDRREADRYEVLEQSVRTGPAEVLTLVALTDGDMLEEEEVWGFGRR